VPPSLRFLSSAAAALTLLVSSSAVGLAQSPSDFYGGPPSQTFGADTVQTEAPGSPTTGGPPSGLKCVAATGSIAKSCSGFLASSVDSTDLDVTLQVPSGGPHPLLVYLHGWGGSKNDGAAYDQMVTGAGYTFLRYSHRGFGQSWGHVNLADVNVEIADLRSLIGQVVDDGRLLADSSRVGVFGVSYGGGSSWLAAVKPTWTSPKGKTVTLRTIVPIVPWTDLLYSLSPNGRPDHELSVAGSVKLSYLEGLYAEGQNTNHGYPNYPTYLTQWNAEITTLEPSYANPLAPQIVNAIEGYRSIWYQQAFWSRVRSNAANGVPQLPVFEIQGFTDDLFPIPEALRMYYSLKSVDPNYPIAEYFGDIGHPRAANKPAEMQHALNLAMNWFNYYVRGGGTAPPLNVMAAITRPSSAPFSPSDVVSVPAYGELATTSTTTGFTGGQVITWNPANFSGTPWDPILQAGETAFQSAPAPPPDEVPGDVAVYESSASTVTQGKLIAGEPVVTLTASTAAYREELNVRLFDVRPDGSSYLITRGTYTLDTGTPTAPIGRVDVVIPMYGDLWQVLGSSDTIRLEVTNVDGPYIEPSRVPSVTALTGVSLFVPLR
jgi:pimeloyl-ACP methyl ester carboxylesterase